jgi:hypothetical protein
MPADISIEEWLGELSRLGVGPGGDDSAWTVTELSEATGHSTVWVRRRLRAAVEAGLVVETMKRIRALGGRPALVPAYRFAGKAPRK